MDYNQEYMSARAALRNFLERLFVVFTVGILLVFVLLKSEVATQVTQRDQFLRQAAEIASEAHASMRID